MIVGHGRGEECGLELAAREVKAAIHHLPEEPAVALGVAQFRGVVIDDGGAGEEERPHAADAIDLEGQGGFGRGLAKSRFECCAHCIEPLVGRVRFQLAERGDAGGHGDGVARVRAGLEDGSGGHDLVHDAGPTAERADGQSAADNLAQTGDIGRVAQQFLSAAVSEAEAGHHFIVNEQRAVMVREPPEFLAKFGVRGNEAHVPDDRLENRAGNSVALGGKDFSKRGRIVVAQHECVVGATLRDAGAVGDAECEGAGTG